MKYELEIKSFTNHVHYYLNNEYLGMLVFDKGELSDFRAIIRKNRQDVNEDNIHKMLRVSLFALLNHYLKEKLFIDENEKLEKTKAQIVKDSDKEISNVSETIIKNKMI
jgi:hypothetical protein